MKNKKTKSNILSELTTGEKMIIAGLSFILFYTYLAVYLHNKGKDCVVDSYQVTEKALIENNEIVTKNVLDFTVTLDSGEQVTESTVIWDESVESEGALCSLKQLGNMEIKLLGRN